jgi:hypothetical protein
MLSHLNKKAILFNCFFFQYKIKIKILLKSHKNVNEIYKLKVKNNEFKILFHNLYHIFILLLK